MMGVPPPESWWRLPCPARGGALTHAHWAACRPDGVHPSDGGPTVGHNHPIAMCCHCELTEQGAREAHAALQASLARTDETFVEPRYFTVPAGRPEYIDLTPHEMFKLAVNVVELERRRGYR